MNGFLCNQLVICRIRNYNKCMFVEILIILRQNNLQLF